MKALIAMSGGVDSSVAAFLTMKNGFDVCGVTLRMFGNDLIGAVGESTCCSMSDVEDAESVCRKLGIPFHVFNFADKFRKDVVERFVKAYEEGRTPNPCIDCNRYVKFGYLFQRMQEMSCDYIVTGHYARVEKDPVSGRFILKKAVDPKKDQSYVLYSLTQEQLAHVMFPLGGMVKSETRGIAEAQGFLNARKHDSQDICFVPDGDYAGFIERYTGKEYPDGDFVDEEGNVLGEHKGIIKYTIGQRKGLGLALPAPLYVCRKDMEKNQVILAPNEKLFSSSCEVCDFNWIAYGEPAEPFHAAVKARYSQKEAPAIVVPLGDGKVRVDFDEPVRAITPGQAAVVYDGDTVIGGGTII